MKYLFLVLSFACLVKINTYARKPAVEPILGVSIEEYKEVSPEKAKGFDFSRNPDSELKAEDSKTIKKEEPRVHNQADITSRPQTSLEDTKSKNLLFILLIALPIMASFISYLRFRVNQKDIENNVVDLNTVKKSSQNDDDNNDIRRAS